MHPLIPRLSPLAAATAFVCSLVNSHVPEPYLDEVFHIPQAQLYCANTFHLWDPKLTTPPGLYLLSYPLSLISTCSPAFLRSINAVGIAVVLPGLVYHILLLLHPRLRSSPAAQAAAAHTAVNIALFPLLFFFAGLYYTDVYSTIFVLASYLFWLQGRTWCSAAMSCGSLWFRQTNVLWTAFLMVLEGVRALEVAQGPEEPEDSEVIGGEEELAAVKEVVVMSPPLQTTTTTITTTTTTTTITAASLLGKKKRRKGRSLSATIVVIPNAAVAVATAAAVVDPKKEEVQEEVQEGPWTIDVKNSKMNNGELGKAWEKVLEMARKIRIWNPVFTEEVTAQDFLFSTPTSLTLALLRHPTSFLLSTAPYALVLSSFSVFIVWNDFSIVLGDKSAHQPTLHIPQLYYFSLFTLASSWPLLVSPEFVKRFWADNVGVWAKLPWMGRRGRGRKANRKLPPAFAAAFPTAVISRAPITIHWGTLLKTALALAVILVTIKKNTYLHPYLLADNRHFVFYIFRRTILAHPAIRYLLAPVYLASVWAVYDALSRSGVVSVVWVWVWSVAVLGTLVTAGLVEGRYFIAAWVLWRLHVERLVEDEAGSEEKKNKKKLWATMGWGRWMETVGFVAVDAGVLWVFLNWGFEWESERGKVQRFMW